MALIWKPTAASARLSTMGARLVPLFGSGAAPRQNASKLPAAAANRPALGDVSNSGSEPGSSAHQKPSAVPVSSAPAAVEWSLQQ